jgi:hypothetical protein
MKINIFWIVMSSSVVLEKSAASIFKWNSTLKMEAASSYETLVNFYETTLHHISEDSNLQLINFLAVVPKGSIPSTTGHNIKSQFYPLPTLTSSFYMTHLNIILLYTCLPM